MTPVPSHLTLHSVTLLVLFATRGAVAQEAVRMEERLPVGSQYHVSSRAELRGTMNLPAEKDKPAKSLPLEGSASVEYDERVLDGDGRGPVQKTLRIYSRLDFQRKLGEQTQESRLRPAAKRMLVLRRRSAEVPFSPDGPLTLGEIDRVKTDVFIPALRGLLPERPVRPGDQWQASASVVEELTDLEEVSRGHVECTLKEVTSRGGRPVAEVSFAGTIRGSNADGPNQQEIRGHYLFDLAGSYVAYVYLTGTSILLDQDGKTVGKLDGTFALTRQPVQKPELRDEVVRLLPMEPTPDNSLLLFDEPALGIRFTYPRRWSIRMADGRQIRLDEPGGGGMVMTMEPLSQLPTGAQFQTEALNALKQQASRVTRVGQPKRLEGTPHVIESFQIEADTDKGAMVLDHLTIRQTAGGATIAARYPAKEAAQGHDDLVRLGRSLQLVPPRK